ncbi:hypothetical protein ACFX14_038448 [Malus domestica]
MNLAEVGCVENDDNYNPVMKKLSLIQEWMERHRRWVSFLEPRRSFRNVEVRELHDEDFVSDEDTERDDEVEFESDIEKES